MKKKAANIGSRKKTTSKSASKATAKKSTQKGAKKSPELVLAYDLGGTKVAVGVVNARGKVIEEIRTPVPFQEGKNAVIKTLGDLGLDFLKRYPSIRRVGMASAGPLDPKKGILLDPTNFKSEKGSWGATPITSILQKRLKRPVYLENDAASAMLAEAWIGRAKGYKNAIVLTLGTGLGGGIICNGELVRSGRGLHPEVGHLVIRANDETAPCGCGKLGCAEAFLSGRNFARRARTRFADPNLTAPEIADLARKRDPRAVAAFAEYAELMAIELANCVVLYSPEIVVFTGSFAEASDLFLEATLDHLKKLIARLRVGVDLLPKLAVSSLNNDAGLIGGAYVAFHR